MQPNTPTREGAGPTSTGGWNLEHEIKFRLERRHLAALRIGLAACCRPDPRHPANVVASVYYDTRQRLALREKLDSDLYKVKVRLRWYESPGSPSTRSPLFVEAKFRLGTRRRKLRLQVPEAARRLADLPLDHPDFLAVPRLLRSAGFDPPADLSPQLVVRYHRERHLDPVTGARISLDREITVPRVNARLLSPVLAPPLDHAVLEVKHRSGALPRHLRPLLALGASLSSFSKYGACFQVVLASHRLRG